MTLKISYSKKVNLKNSRNLVLFCNEKISLTNLKIFLSSSEYNFINDLLKTIDKKKKFFDFSISSKKNIILIPIKNDIESFDCENLGADFFSFLKKNKKNEYIFISDSISQKDKNFLGLFLHGLKLKSYEFEKYKTKKKY